MKFKMAEDLPAVKRAVVGGKRVLARVDFDVPLDNEGQVADTTRIEQCLPTVNFLLEKKAKVILISHLGRPEGKRVEKFSLKPVVNILASFLGPKARVIFWPYVVGERVKEKIKVMAKDEVLLLENLRFYPGEEGNDLKFCRQLASLGDIFVNEAFANSHREHASIVGLPCFLPSFVGLNFRKEVQVLSRVYRHPQRPVVVILGGKKESKILAGQILLGWVDTILVGGKLVEMNTIKEFAGHIKVMADLTKKGEDITLESSRKFAQVIGKAGTIIWSGPMGAYEDSRYLKGTKVVAEAIVRSKAFSVVGGGDTEAALTQLGLNKKINFISSGGGAMLSFLAQRGTLPGIEAIRKNSN